MNCEPGDLAVVANDMGLVAARPLLGVVVRVVELYGTDDRWGPIWCIDATVERGGIRFNCIADAMLKPLRDPGDDAVDETLQRLGLPEEETV